MNVLIPDRASQESYISSLGEIIGSGESELALQSLPVEKLLYTVRSYCYSGQYP